MSRKGKEPTWTPELRAEVDEFREAWRAMDPRMEIAFDAKTWGSEAKAMEVAKATGTIRSELGDAMILAWIRWERTGCQRGAWDRIVKTVPGLEQLGAYPWMLQHHDAFYFLGSAAALGRAPGKSADRIASMMEMGARMEAAGELPERRRRRQKRP